MKKFWKRRGRNISTTSSSVDDSEILNPITLIGEGSNCSPIVFQNQSLGKEGADDNVSSANDADTLGCTTIATSNTSCNTNFKESFCKALDKDVSNCKRKVVNAYNCCSSSIFAVAATMDRFLTACSDSICDQNNEDETTYETTYASLSENGGTKSSSFLK